MSGNRELLGTEDVLRAMVALLEKGHDLRIEMWAYRTHNGNPMEDKADWGGPLAFEVIGKVYVHDTYLPSAEARALFADIEALGFDWHLSGAGEGYVTIRIGRDGQRRVLARREP